MAKENTPELSKADKFKQLAESRTSKAMNAIATLRGLSNKNNYEYTEEQAKQIIAALDGEIQILANAFSGKVAAKGGFTLS